MESILGGGGLTESGAIIIATIGASQAIILAVLGYLSKKTRSVAKESKETHEQVVNHHDTNFRIESDERHAEIMEWFGSLSGKVGRQARRIDGVMMRLDTVENKLDKDEVYNNVPR